MFVRILFLFATLLRLVAGAEYLLFLLFANRSSKQYGFPDNFDYTAVVVVLKLKLTEASWTPSALLSLFRSRVSQYTSLSKCSPLNNLPEGCEIVQVHALIRYLALPALLNDAVMALEIRQRMSGPTFLD